jgi:hypothetical protein
MAAGLAPSPRPRGCKLACFRVRSGNPANEYKLVDLQVIAGDVGLPPIR